MKTYLLGLLFLMCGMHVFAAEQEAWIRGQDAYREGHYEEAIKAFQEALATKPHAAGLQYDLGNAYLRNNEPGKAILWYERALRKKPYDSDIRHNLSLAKKKRQNAVVEIQEFFLTRAIRSIANVLSPLWWGVFSMLLFWGCIALIALSVIRKDWKAFRYALIALSIGFLLALLCGIRRYKDVVRQDLAVTTESQIDLRIAPADDAKLLSTLGSGEKVLILDSLGGYYKVRIANYEQGWVRADAVTKI